MVQTEAEARDKGRERRAAIYRLAEEGLKVVPGVGYLHPTLQDLAYLIYPDRPDSIPSLLTLAGRIATELKNRNERLQYIVRTSEFAGSPSAGIISILRRRIPYEEAQRVAQKARGKARDGRNGGLPFRGSRTLVYRKPTLAEESFGTTQDVRSRTRNKRPPVSAPIPETPADPRILDDAHVCKLLEYFAHMSRSSMAFYGLEIPTFIQTEMLEVMQSMRKRDSSIVANSETQAQYLSQKLKDFPVDNSPESLAKRNEFLTVNPSGITKNILAVVGKVRPERYRQFLADIQYKEIKRGRY